jgi:hypothetical protein
VVVVGQRIEHHDTRPVSHRALTIARSRFLSDDPSLRRGRSCPTHSVSGPRATNSSSLLSGVGGRDSDISYLNSNSSAQPCSCEGPSARCVGSASQ